MSEVTSRQKAALAIPWAIGMTIGHALVGFTSPWSAIVALYIIGILHGLLSLTQ